MREREREKIEGNTGQPAQEFFVKGMLKYLANLGQPTQEKATGGTFLCHLSSIEGNCVPCTVELSFGT